MIFLLTLKKDGCLIIRFAVVILAIFFGGCNRSSNSENKELEITTSITNEAITSVVTANTENKTFEYRIQSNGKIKSLHEQLVNCENGGRLLICNAQTGRRFSAGTTILQFETITIEHKLQRAKLAFFNDKKEYESQLLGYENLLKDKTKEEADDIKQKLKISTGLAVVEQDIKEANYELSKTIIKAPFSGILADVNVQQGQQLKPGDDLFRIYDPYNMILEMKILEADISMLKQGTPAEISPISNSRIIYKAAVYEINPYVDENGMVTVRLKVAGNMSSRNVTQQSLFPGMNCMATIKIPCAKTLVVPKDAIVMRNGKAVVFTLEDSKAKWNYVTTGRENENEIEINKGLKVGQKVIVTNNLQLSHDAPVKETSEGLNN